jgi:methionine aminopeptidase
MHRACTIVVETLEVLAQAAVAGTTTKELDTLSRERIVKAGAKLVAVARNPIDTAWTDRL